MKAWLLAIAVLALAVAAYLSPAMAQMSEPSGSNTRPGISRNNGTGAPDAATATVHYEYQYGYGHRGAWRGRWVLVR